MLKEKEKEKNHLSNNNITEIDVFGVIALHFFFILFLTNLLLNL
jgi:hypothetical protein